ncbi:MAG: hypothetical protein AAFS10_15290 [Myxococcota bacterium]
MLPYTFEPEEGPSGVFTLTFDGDRIVQQVRVEQEGRMAESRFELRAPGQHLTHFRVGDEPWTSMEGFPDDAYPGSAFVLLLSEAKERPFVFQRIRESSGTVEGWTTLERRGNMITERDHERITRRFWVDDNDRLVRVDWGLAESRLCATLEQAWAGDPL